MHHHHTTGGIKNWYRADITVRLILLWVKMKVRLVTVSIHKDTYCWNKILFRLLCYCCKLMMIYEHCVMWVKCQHYYYHRLKSQHSLVDCNSPGKVPGLMKHTWQWRLDRPDIVYKVYQCWICDKKRKAVQHSSHNYNEKVQTKPVINEKNGTLSLGNLYRQNLMRLHTYNQYLEIMRTRAGNEEETGTTFRRWNTVSKYSLPFLWKNTLSQLIMHA